MKVFGLTGSIGMGKSTSDQLLRERGVAVVDTDLLARQIVEPGQPALAEIKNLFGQEMLAPDGRLRREDLARRVFADAAARKQLVKFCIRASERFGWPNWMSGARKANRSRWR